MPTPNEQDDGEMHAAPDANPPEEQQPLPPDAATADDNRNPRRRAAAVPSVGIVVEPDPLRHNFERVILHPEAKSEILAGLRAMRVREDMERVFGISAIQPQTGRCLFNFYGAPGTGKTLAALCIANELGKRVFQVDYASIISKYIGDTAKHIVSAFKATRELDAVLFFDEGDALLSRRVDSSESCSTSINQNRAVLMQELDRFGGVVIVTTNLFENYDPAVLRRIQRHVKFELPNRAMRRKLLELHFPKGQRVRADLGDIAREARGLSGGDLLNVCVNAMHAASEDENPQNWFVTDGILRAQIAKVRSAKNEHDGKAKSTSPGTIGFHASAEA